MALFVDSLVRYVVWADTHFHCYHDCFRSRRSLRGNIDYESSSCTSRIAKCVSLGDGPRLFHAMDPTSNSSLPLSSCVCGRHRLKSCWKLFLKPDWRSVDVFKVHFNFRYIDPDLEIPSVYQTDGTMDAFFPANQDICSSVQNLEYHSLMIIALVLLVCM